MARTRGQTMEPYGRESEEGGLEYDSCLQANQSGFDFGDDPPAISKRRANNAARRAAEGSGSAERDLGVAEPQYTGIRQARACTPRIRGPQDIRAIVMHTPEGGEPGTLSVLDGDRAGFDFFLPLSGNLYKCNDYKKFIAWQAGDWAYNERSVGIEQGDFASRSGQFPDEHYRRLAKLVAYLIQTTSTPFQYARSYGEDGIIDHATITPQSRTDPGAGFRRDFLMELVRQELEGGSNGTVIEIFWTPGSLAAVQGAIARKSQSRQAAEMHRLEAGQVYKTDGFTDDGEVVAGSGRWFHLTQESGFGWVHSSGGRYTPA